MAARLLALFNHFRCALVDMAKRRPVPAHHRPQATLHECDACMRWLLRELEPAIAARHLRGLRHRQPRPLILACATQDQERSLLDALATCLREWTDIVCEQPRTPQADTTTTRNVYQWLVGGELRPSAWFGELNTHSQRAGMSHVVCVVPPIDSRAQERIEAHMLRFAKCFKTCVYEVIKRDEKSLVVFQWPDAKRLDDAFNWLVAEFRAHKWLQPTVDRQEAAAADVLAIGQRAAAAVNACPRCRCGIAFDARQMSDMYTSLRELVLTVQAAVFPPIMTIDDNNNNNNNLPPPPRTSTPTPTSNSSSFNSQTSSVIEQFAYSTMPVRQRTRQLQLHWSAEQVHACFDWLWSTQLSVERLFHAPITRVEHALDLRTSRRLASPFDQVLCGQRLRLVQHAMLALVDACRLHLPQPSSNNNNAARLDAFMAWMRARVPITWFAGNHLLDAQALLLNRSAQFNNSNNNSGIACASGAAGEPCPIGELDDQQLRDLHFRMRVLYACAGMALLDRDNDEAIERRDRRWMPGEDIARELQVIRLVDDNNNT